MTTYDVPHPPIVMFEGPGGEESLLDLFQGRRQLLIYHFMFDPSWEKGCPGCTAYANSIGDLSLLDKCDTTFVMVSRAPRSKLEAYKERQGWPFTWVSSLGSEFNYDFHVTNDEKIAPVEYNYRKKADLEANNVPNAITGEEHGLSVFFRIGEHVFHTYSAYARGTEALTNTLPSHDGYRGVHHRTRIRATRWLNPSYEACRLRQSWPTDQNYNSCHSRRLRTMVQATKA